LSRPRSFVTPARMAWTALFVAEAAVLLAIALPAEVPAVEGVMVRADEAIIEVEDQTSFSSVTVKRVLMPTDGWLMVQAEDSDGKPGPVIGAEAVKRGESADVTVRIARDPQLPSTVYVTLVADAGDRGRFEPSVGGAGSGGMGGGMGGSGAQSADGAPQANSAADKPLIADGNVVSATARLTQFSEELRTAGRMDAAVLSADEGHVTVSRLKAPVPSWVAITSQSGDTATVFGWVRVPAGESAAIEVPMDKAPDGRPLMAWLHADLATRDAFDWRASDYANSPDPAYFDGAWSVAVPVDIPLN